MYAFMCVCHHNCTGTVIEGPRNVTYLPRLTPLPIELTCNVTGVALWEVNDTDYSLGSLTNGILPGHNRTSTNILVNSPVNNTEYICVSQTNDGSDISDPAYIIIAGEECAYTYVRMYLYICMHVRITHTCLLVFVNNYIRMHMVRNLRILWIFDNVIILQ